MGQMASALVYRIGIDEVLFSAILVPIDGRIQSPPVRGLRQGQSPALQSKTSAALPDCLDMVQGPGNVIPGEYVDFVP